MQIDPDRTAVVIIDMQRDFLEPGGFGDSLGNDVGAASRARSARARRCWRRRAGTACWSSTRARATGPIWRMRRRAKIERGAPVERIGDAGPMGRILIRGEAGPRHRARALATPGEPVIDKPGKGAFYATDLHAILRNRGIDALIVCGVTTEVCVHTTVREANDRGYRCIVPAIAAARISRSFTRSACG